LVHSRNRVTIVTGGAARVGSIRPRIKSIQ
jgi:hypothetical protein